jgi:hypothetical protein
MHTMRNRKKLYKKFNTHLTLRHSIMILLILFFSSCGKKAPPVPPRQAKPPTVNDLRTPINGGTLKLTWAIPKEKGGIISDLPGFIFNRSKMLDSYFNCKNSPVLFKCVADILIEVSASGYIKKVLLRTLNPSKRSTGISYTAIVYGKGIIRSESNYVDLIY